MKTNYRKFLISFLSLGVMGMLFFVACSVDDAEDSFNPKATNKFVADKANTLEGKNQFYKATGYTVAYANTCHINSSTGLAEQTWVYVKNASDATIQASLNATVMPDNSKAVGNPLATIKTAVNGGVINYDTDYDLKVVTYAFNDCQTTALPLYEQVISGKADATTDNASQTEQGSLPSGATSAFAMNLHVDNLTITPYSSLVVQQFNLATVNPTHNTKDGWKKSTDTQTAEFWTELLLQVIASNAAIKNSTETTFSGYNTGETWKVDDDVIPRALTPWAKVNRGQCGTTGWTAGETKDIPLRGEMSCPLLETQCASLNGSIFTNATVPNYATLQKLNAAFPATINFGGLTRNALGAPLNNTTTCQRMCDFVTQAYIDHGGLPGCSALPPRHDKFFAGKFTKFQLKTAFSVNATYINQVTVGNGSLTNVKADTLLDKATNIWLSSLAADTADITGNFTADDSTYSGKFIEDIDGNPISENVYKYKRQF